MTARSPFSWKVTLASIGLTLGLLPAPQAQTTNQIVSAASASRSFVIQSESRIRNIELGIWAEEVLNLVSDFMERPVPLGRGQPVYIQLLEDPEREASVVPRQQIKNRFLTQRLQITNFGQGDEEDLLEALCQLLLSRYAMAAQPPSLREERPAQVPAWFAVGVAQQLHPILRDRNRRLCVRWQQEKRLYDVPDILELSYLPRGRLRSKVVCGVFIEWLHDPSRRALIAKMMQAWARGDEINADWLIEQQVDIADTTYLAKQWQLWIADIRQNQSELGGNIYAAVDHLKARLVLQPMTLGIEFPQDGPEAISFRGLMDHYEAPWFARLVGQATVRISLPGLRQPAEFQAILKQYQEYLMTLQTLPALVKKRRTSRIESMLRKANVQLNEANLALAEYEEQVNKWRAYVDLAEDATRETSSTQPMRTAFQKFVDEAEKKEAAWSPDVPQD